MGAPPGACLLRLREARTGPADGWSTAFVAGAAFFAFAAYFVWRHAPRPVHIPAEVPTDRAPGPLSASDEAQVPEGKYSLNHATFEQLREAGMSVIQAKRVIAFRQVNGAFTSVSQLDLVPGFSRTSLAELKQVFVVPVQQPEQPEPEAVDGAGGAPESDGARAEVPDRS